MQKITPFLWFDTQAEEAVDFYASIFPDTRIHNVSRYMEGSPGEPGRVMVIEFELLGQRFLALNAGPEFKFNEAVSFMVHCETQEEVDHYWNRLTDGGEESMCGWLKDRYGLSWQITPTMLVPLLSDPDKTKAGRAMQAMMTMQKLDIAALQHAFDNP